MKALITILTTASFLTFGLPRASANDCGWATAGKVLTGVAIGGAVAATVAAATQPPPTLIYSAPSVVYAPAPVVTYAPAPVVVAAPAPVYYVQPAPVVVYSAPVYRPYVYPRYYGPGVAIRVGFGGGHYYHHGH
jgi:hypothetical protein